jgi:hypothetical protein
MAKIKLVSDTKLVNAGTTLGIDEMFFTINMDKKKKKLNLLAASVGMKDIKFKRPLIQWKQQYQKLNL